MFGSITEGCQGFVVKVFPEDEEVGERERCEEDSKGKRHEDQLTDPPLVRVWGQLLFTGE